MLDQVGCVDFVGAVRSQGERAGDIGDDINLIDVRDIEADSAGALAGAAAKVDDDAPGGFAHMRIIVRVRRVEYQRIRGRRCVNIRANRPGRELAELKTHKRNESGYNPQSGLTFAEAIAMDIGLMVEGQNGLTWERWSHILALAERLQFPTVFRSDHYFIGRQQDSLDAYLSFVMAASQPKTIRFGPLVSPVTFRSPVQVGRMAAQIDRLSGGRFVMGMGAGWNEPEHKAYGIPFPTVRERMDRLEESINVVRALWAPGPATYTGRYYSLDGADCMPKPAAGRPPILIGGGGEKRTLRLAARYADEWNGVNFGPDVYARKAQVLEQHCEAEKRDPAAIRRSMMIFCRWEDLLPKWSTQQGEVIANGVDQLLDVIGQLGRSGLQEIQFQHFDFDDDSVPEYLASEVVPRVKGL